MTDRLPSVEMVAGEFGFNFELTITDDDANVVTLNSDDVVAMAYRAPGDDSAATAIGTGSVYSASGGVVRVAVGSGDTITKGQYYAQITVTNAGGTVVRVTKRFWLKVEGAI